MTRFVKPKQHPTGRFVDTCKRKLPGGYFVAVSLPAPRQRLPHYWVLQPLPTQLQSNGEVMPMHRLFLLTLLFLSAAAALSEERLPLLISFDLPATDLTPPDYYDDRDYPNFAGRLYVKDVNIDVALYRSNDQEVVDRKDSAAYFDLSYARGSMIIADHNTHAFSALGRLKTGVTASIVRDDGATETYVCVSVFKGHNTGKGITDWQGVSVVGRADLMMYTCFDGWQNVWVVLWNRVQAPEDLLLLQRFGNDMASLIDQLLETAPPAADVPDGEIELFMQVSP